MVTHAKWIDRLKRMEGSRKDAARRLVIWKSEWLPPSETFVRNHEASLNRWQPVCCGLSRVNSYLSSDTDRFAFSDSLTDRIRKRTFSATGRSGPVARLLKEADASLVHAHFAGEAIRIRHTCKRLDIPLVVTLHGQDITEAPNTPGIRGLYYRLRLRRVFEDAALILAVSEHIRNRAIELGANPERVRVHYLGAPVHKVPTVPINELERGIVAVGRLVEKKGFSHLIRAISKIPEAGRVQLTIVGDGPLMNELKDLAHSLNVTVTFTGSLESGEALLLMRKSLFVCVPSVKSSSGDEEGLPTVAMEAGLCSRAVVGYRHSGIPEVVENGVTGILVEEGDIDGLSQALIRLCNEPVVAERMGASASRRIREEFNIVTQAAKLEEIYDSIAR